MCCKYMQSTKTSWSIVHVMLSQINLYQHKICRQIFKSQNLWPINNLNLTLYDVYVAPLTAFRIPLTHPGWSTWLQRFSTHMKVFFVVILLFTFFRRDLAGSRSCTQQYSEYGFTLVEHVYHSFSTNHLFACYNACHTQPACQSLNYDLADKTCQFNTNTKYFRPEYFVKKGNSIYAGNPDSGKLQLIHVHSLRVCF